MAKAYLIGQVTVTNPEGYAQYSAQVPASVAAFGGAYRVRGGTATQLEGQASGERPTGRGRSGPPEPAG